MAVCQICGCKTDDLDFVECRIGTLDKKVCSFCHRQLKSLGNDEINSSQLKWLSAVVEKDVPDREADVHTALREIMNKYGAQAQEPLQSAEVKYYPPARGKCADGSANESTIQELAERVEKLEKQLVAMKRAYLIKTVCEIAIPIILGIIILIVFFSSGFYNTIADLYRSFS